MTSRDSQRLPQALGWISGAVGGFMASYGSHLLLGQWIPAQLLTFIWVVAGCVLGSWLGARVHGRGVPILGMVAGTLTTVLVIGFLLLSSATR